MARKNPDMTLWLLVAGAAVGAFFLFRKKADAKTKPGVPLKRPDIKYLPTPTPEKFYPESAPPGFEEDIVLEGF